jgi:hypothetical protein
MRIRRQGETLSVGRKQGKQGRKERSREGIRKKKRKEENKETRRNEGQFLLGANGKAMRKDGKKVEKRGKWSEKRKWGLDLYSYTRQGNYADERREERWRKEGWRK